ncbi:hypothetical protein IFM89_036806 [Coptis chinensis]|uniref:N-acetyltransferase domain-containing protein n=1 Tax=Coptis chinensis TaxID=261450 RepID=A0A835LQ03_9MAGN|nr:hypothetical protein IFM89_036806 [Coptis chinensis]
MELKGIVSPEFLRIPLVFAKKRKLNNFLCVVRDSSSHQFRYIYFLTWDHRWKPIEVHCNDSAHSILQSSVCTSDSTTLPELAFGRLQTTDLETCGIQKRRFGRFVARGVVLDEEYWTASWLRAEAHWESVSYMRHVDSYKRKCAEQEFYALKRRCGGRDGNSLSCFCMVTVKDDKNVKRTVLNSVVGTLDLSIRQFLQGETYPGEHEKYSAVLASHEAYDMHKYAYIANLCVSKFARRQGIASNMLYLATDIASLAGMKQLFVHVNADNIPAQELYNKTGFEMVEAASSPLSKDQRLLMSMQLKCNLGMKESKPISTLKRILITCTAQAKDYGTCVAAKVPEVDRDMCLKEFLALKSCMQNVRQGLGWIIFFNQSCGIRFISSRSPSVRIVVPEENNMLGAALTTQSSGGLSESASLSHVYIQHPPLRCSIPGSRGLFYDDGNKLLLSPASDRVFVWKTAPISLQDAPSVDLIDEGPVLSIRYSLDGKVIGIQRSNQEIQFRNRETGQDFTQRCRSDSESILGFFWTDCATCDVIFVKTSGLDLFTYESELKALRFVETKKLNVSWYVYTHESRMALLASGMQCKTLSGFQFSAGGVIRVPRFDMAMAKAEANKKPVLAEEDLHIVTIYGRIYCSQVDRVAMLLHLYRFYRDAVVRQCSLPIYSSKIAVSVIDNVLLVHQVDAKVVILYDIFSDSRAPISAPLPLLLRGLPRINASTRSSGKDALHMETIEMTDHEAVVYGDGWIFLVPDLICDAVHVLAIAASSSEAPTVLEFLQRRKLETKKAKQLCLAIMRTLILERRPVSVVSKAIDVLVSSYSHSMKTEASFPRRTAESKKASTSSSQQFDGSGAVDDESRSQLERHGNPNQHGLVSGLEKESQHSMLRDTGNESLDFDECSRINRLSLSSDSEDSSNSERIVEVSNAEVEQPSSQSRARGIVCSDVSEDRDSQVTSVAVSPDEMYSLVFSLIEEEMTGEPSYLVSILVEYFRSAASEKLKVHTNLNVMTIQLLARSERYAELGLFVIHKIFEPSKEVALQLLDSGRQDFQTRKLGMDMLRQLSLHHDYVLLLVQDGYYLEALRYAHKNKVNSIRPSLFLESAYASSDPQHLAAVLRFFADFIPGFKNSSEHSTYCRILNEMNTSIVA